jgi:hypothetical protein
MRVLSQVFTCGIFSYAPPRTYKEKLGTLRGGSEWKKLDSVGDILADILPNAQDLRPALPHDSALPV